MKRFLAITLITALTAALLVSPACAAGPKPGGKLTFGMSSDMRQLDPHLMVTTPEGRYFRLIAEPLVDGGPDFQPAPCLAESWTFSSDGLSWTFNLRQGVKWHNGREMTAKDIKWNFDRMLDPKTRAAVKGRLLAVSSVEVVDKYTIRFKLNRPSTGFASMFYGAGGFAAMIAPESMGDDGKVTHPIGTGPFKFVEWKPKDYVRYTKFDQYWHKGLPYLDEVVIKPIPDPSVRLMALRSGELDMTYKLNIDEVVGLQQKKLKGVVFDLDCPSLTQLIFFNMKKPPFDDPRVRTAVSLAISKEDMLLAVFEGHGEVVNQVFSTSSPWYCDVAATAQDIEQAKKLMAEAGYGSGVKVDLAVSNSFPDFVRTAQVIQMQLAEIGMELNLLIEDWPAHIKRDQSGEYNMGIIGWSGTSDPETLYPMAFSTKGPLHFLMPGYASPRLEELIDRGGSAKAFAERKAIYTEAARLVVSDAPWIFLLTSPNAYGWKAKVKGFKPAYGHHIYMGDGLQRTWLDQD